MSAFSSDPMEDTFTAQSLAALQCWGQSSVSESGLDPAKRQKREPPKRGRVTEDKDPSMRDAMRLMASLVLRREQDLQQVARQDTFLLFLVPSQEGCVPLLHQAHKEWSDAKERTLTLRAHLVLQLLRELQRRLLKLMTGGDQCQIRAQLVKNGVLLEDHTWPFLQWDSRDKRLVLNKTKQAMTMSQAQELLEELLSLVKQDDAIQKFHAMGKPQEGKSQPWKLQIGLRQDRLHGLLTGSSHSSLWQILGIQLKPHSQRMSPLGIKLQEVLKQM